LLRPAVIVVTASINENSVVDVPLAAREDPSWTKTGLGTTRTYSMTRESSVSHGSSSHGSNPPAAVLTSVCSTSRSPKAAESGGDGR
jgi:hypothetical protein